MGVAASALRSYGASVRLGWKVSSNWTRPTIFLVYSVVRPISTALILVVMYSVITGGRGNAYRYLAFLVVGQAFWSFIQEGLAEFATGILEDRGRYKMLKYAYLAPQRFPLFLLGRATAKFGSAAASVVIVLAIGTLVLRLPIDPLTVDYPLLLAACLLALVAVLAFGVLFSMLLLAGRDSYGYGEISAQVLYIFSGAIFPISVLPHPIAIAAALSPLPYWLELVRRALLHERVYQMFPELSDGQVLARLAASTAATVVVCWLAYVVADRRARRQGYIDMEANW
jgi:ABC-2 type transport system permease protein